MGRHRHAQSVSYDLWDVRSNNKSRRATRVSNKRRDKRYA
jgi:hypothetical protein